MTSHLDPLVRLGRRYCSPSAWPAYWLGVSPSPWPRRPSRARRPRWTRPAAAARPRSRSSRAAASGACRACSSTSTAWMSAFGLRRRRAATAHYDMVSTATPATRNWCRSPSTRTRSPTAAPADLLLGRARSDRAQPPGPGRGNAVPLDHLPDERGAGGRREGLYRAAERRPRIRFAGRHDHRAGQDLLSRGSLSSGLSRPESRPTRTSCSTTCRRSRT